MYDYALGAIMGASIALLGTASCIQHIENQPAPAQEVTPKGEMPVKAPSSPVEAFEAEEAPSVPEEPKKDRAPRPTRRRLKPKPAKVPVNINLESDDPLEGVL